MRSESHQWIGSHLYPLHHGIGMAAADVCHDDAHPGKSPRHQIQTEVQPIACAGGSWPPRSSYRH
jgi:hypothetical protein